MGSAVGAGRVDGFVLAGGVGSRMGVDKARLAWDGRPLAVVVAETLQACCERVVLVRREEDDLPWPGQEVVYEPAHPGTHPLFGVAAALEACRTSLAMILPCDVPHIRPEHLELLRPGPCVATVDGHLHPLVVVLPAAWSGRVLAAAEAGESARRVVSELRQVELPAEALLNVNTPEDRRGPGPVARLTRSLSWLAPAERAQVLAGERRRLAAHGMVDLRYPPSPRRAEDG